MWITNMIQRGSECAAEGHPQGKYLMNNEVIENEATYGGYWFTIVYLSVG